METIVHPGQADQGGSNSGGLLDGADFQSTTAPGSGGRRDIGVPGAAVPASIGPTLFFCIPRNEKLVGYWDTVADRLFKIRHCMNIEGVVRQLAAVRAADRPGAARAGDRQPVSTSATRWRA